MRRFLINLLSAAVLAGSGLALAQAPPPTTKTEPAPPEKTSLEELLDLALKNNPDIRVAEAKLREAEAELNRTKLAVVQKVITFQTTLAATRKAVANAEARHKRVEELHRTGQAGGDTLDQAAETLARTKAELATLEGETPYLLGQSPRAELQPWFKRSQIQFVDVPINTPPASPAGWASRLPTTVETKLRAALDTRVKVELSDAQIDEVLEYLQDSVPDLTFRNRLPHRDKGQPSVTLRSKDPLPIRAVLQFLEDEFATAAGSPGLRFVVREYGLLVVTPEAVPPGALLLQDFVRGNNQDGRVPPTVGRKNPPTESLTGQIKRVDAATGLVTLSIGSDGGLQKGHTLEVYRLKPQPRYLGTLTVVEVQPTEAVGRMSGNKDEIQVGDQVSNKTAN